jgi:hypothetical protein
MLEGWMRSYRPEELFDQEGCLVHELAALAPRGERRMGANPHANGGKTLTALALPEFRDYALPVTRPAAERHESTRQLGRFMRDIFRRNGTQANFRLFCPDETASNRLGDVFEVEDLPEIRDWVWPMVDSTLARRFICYLGLLLRFAGVRPRPSFRRPGPRVRSSTRHPSHGLPALVHHENGHGRAVQRPCRDAAEECPLEAALRASAHDQEIRVGPDHHFEQAGERGSRPHFSPDRPPGAPESSGARIHVTAGLAHESGIHGGQLTENDSPQPGGQTSRRRDNPRFDDTHNGGGNARRRKTGDQFHGAPGLR